MKKKLFYIINIGIIIFVCLIAFFSFYIYSNTSNHYQNVFYRNISIRKFPYPLCKDKKRYQEITNVVRNDPDYTGRKSIMIPIEHLKKIDRLIKMYRKKVFLNSIG